jgi:hypothetical protein
MSQRRRNIRTQTEQELAELEAAEQANQHTETGGQQTTTSEEHQPATTGVLTAPAQEEEPGESRSHLVKHRAPRAEAEEEQFDSVYKRDTYYIDRTYIKKLKKLIKDSQHTKTYLMNEALDLLFEKYNIE